MPRDVSNCIKEYKSNMELARLTLDNRLKHALKNLVGRHFYEDNKPLIINAYIKDSNLCLLFLYNNGKTDEFKIINEEDYAFIARRIEYSK